MLEYFFSIPIVLLALVSPFLSPLKIIKYLVMFFAVAEPYIAGASLIALTPVIYYKLIARDGYFLFKSGMKILFLFMFWLFYSFVTILWAKDLYRFFTEFIQLFFILSIVYAFYCSIRTIEDIIFINRGLIISGILVSSVSIIASIGSDYAPINYYAVITLITCVVIPISFVEFKIVDILEALVLLLMGFLGIIVNESRGATLLFIFSLILRFLFLNQMKRNTKIIFLIIGLFFSIYAINIIYNSSEDNILRSVTDTERNFSNLERLALLEQSFNIFLDNLSGVGFGATNSVFMASSSLTTSSYPHPHNTLAHLVVELGIIGLIIYFIIFYNLIRVNIILFKRRHFTTISRSLYCVSLLTTIILFVYSFLDDMLFNGMFSFYCLIFIGYVLALRNIQYNKEVDAKKTP